MMKNALKRVGSACALLVVLGCSASVAWASDPVIHFDYTGEQKEMLVSGSDLFSHVDNGLPGDTFLGRVVIENDGSEPCEFFTTTKDVIADGPDDTLERIGFNVSQKDEAALFDDALSAAERTAAISLGVVEPGQTMQTDYAVTIPAELTSEYADTSVGLNVAIVAVERPIAAADSSGGGEGTGLVQTGGGANTGASANLGHTGDTLPMLPFVLGITAAVGTVICCAWKRRMRMW